LVFRLKYLQETDTIGRMKWPHRDKIGKVCSVINKELVLQTARSVIDCEIREMEACSLRLGESFLQAVDLLFHTKGKVILIGIGKSGQIGAKIASTFRSTGTSAVFLHAAEAVHGDLGLFVAGDPVIAISKSGATEEVLRLLPAIRRFQSPLIALLGNVESPLGEQADIVLDASVQREADPLGIAPTASAVVALAVGDALAGCLSTLRGFSRQDFLSLHPSGQLGRNLNLKVEDVFHRKDRVACLSPEDTVKSAVIAMTRRALGAACVLDADGLLLGIVTDGDVRRSLEKSDDLLSCRLDEIMTKNPVVVRPEMDLHTAVELMEDRLHQISVLPVVDSSHHFCGLVRVHDIYQSRLA